ncbi:hypothetical protein FRC10_005624 [Ceratobasidium sp. 414]|nr:hypothetical protein FRC10_005624 [Ceratobasidium sp. 414]
MADLQFHHHLLPPAPFAPPRAALHGPGLTLAAIRDRTLPGTPSEGQNAEEPIMIGSSDEEDEGEDERPLAHMHLGPGRGTIAEQRARLHNNRTGTPIPRAPENGLRIMSPPPLPQLGHLHHFHRRPEWPHPHHQHLHTLHQRLAASGIRPPEVLQRLIGHDRVGRLLGLVFGPAYAAEQQGQGNGPNQGPNQNQEYDVRMTHARARPRIGYSFDFAPDEDEEASAAVETKAPAVRTRTTIIIPDSPPTQPVDRKGKGRAVDEVLDLESDEWNASPGPGPSTSVSVSSPPRKRRKRQAVEIVEVLSDDDMDTDKASEPRTMAQPIEPEKVQTVLVCASCRRPLRMGGDRLWALRCGHMIDSRCYRKLAERPIVPEDVPMVDAEPVEETTTRKKKRRATGGRAGKAKGKGKAAAPAVPAPPVPRVAETLEWACPVNVCGRVHWSERVVTGATNVWQPMKETGAVGWFESFLCVWRVDSICACLCNVFLNEYNLWDVLVSQLWLRRRLTTRITFSSTPSALPLHHMIWPTFTYIEQNVVSTCCGLPAMRGISQLLVGASTLLGATAQLAQLDSIPGLPTPAQLASALASGPPSRLHPRVPLSTNDNTSIPLHDVQLLHPPPVPKSGTHCTVELLKHEFGQGSYDTPAVVGYSPPSGEECGVVGRWGAGREIDEMSRNGTQYDRLSSVYLDHVEIWRHSSAEPTKTGTVWTALKDLTPYTALLAKNGTLLMDFGNIISAELGLDGVFHVSLTATFYSGAAPSIDVPPSEVVLPLSNLSPNHSNYFSISDSAVGGVTSVSVPENTVKAVVEVYCSGNGAEEFWYLNTPDEIADYFSPDAGLAAKGPFREVQVLVDGKLAGVVWPFPVIYTGGITPTNWRPLTSYGAYNQPTYFVDITPFLPTLTDSATHNITLTVAGQGLSPLHSINSNWFVSGNVRLTLGSSGTRTMGTIKSYTADPFVSPSVKGSAGPGNKTIYASVGAARKLRIESELIVGGKEKRSVVFEQDLKYENGQKYVDDGWVQWGTQLTTGYTKSSINGKVSLLDTFSYPLSVFSNYTLYSMQFGKSLFPIFSIYSAYGSEINQTFTRALLPPSGRAHTLLWTSRAQGWVGMDDAPGLRHAINGTGETVQSFGYGDIGGETYLRKSHVKNDGWVEDVVWGSLASMNPPVKDTSPGGGTGFRRRDFGGRMCGLRSGVCF